MNKYCERSGCHDCFHCFVLSMQDEDTVYYCSQDKTIPEHRRPYYGFKSAFTFNLKEKELSVLSKRMDAWHEWTKTHEVKAWGYCAEWNLLDKEDFNKLPKKR